MREPKRVDVWGVGGSSPCELSLVKTSRALELVPIQQHSKTGVGPRWTGCNTVTFPAESLGSYSCGSQDVIPPRRKAKLRRFTDMIESWEGNSRMHPRAGERVRSHSLTIARIGFQVFAADRKRLRLLTIRHLELLQCDSLVHACEGRAV